MFEIKVLNVLNKYINKELSEIHEAEVFQLLFQMAHHMVETQVIAS